VSWGNDNVLEFFKNETPSKISSASAEASQLEPVPYSPTANLPLTPIHYHKESVASLSVVSEEEDNNINTSQNSPFNSQTSLSTIFPEQEPCILESLNWKLPSRQRNLNKTPKKNLKVQRKIEELKNSLIDKVNELQDLTQEIEKFKRLAIKTKAEQGDFNNLKQQWIEQYNQEKFKAEAGFNEAVKEFGDKGFDEFDGWEVVKDSNVKVFRFRAHLYDVEGLSNLVLMVSSNSVEFGLVNEFRDQDVMRVWTAFKGFMEAQSFGSRDEMLREFRVLWTYFCRFGQSLGKLKRIAGVCEVNCTSEYCVRVLGC
jgi:hypothetical protein